MPKTHCHPPVGSSSGGTLSAPARLPASPSERSARLADYRTQELAVPGGDGALYPTAVLLSVTASVKRHGIDPWAYLKNVLAELPARSAGTGLSDLLPDRWDRSWAGPVPVRG